MRASDVKRGQAVMIDGKLYVVTGADHNTPGNLRAKVQFKLRDVLKGTIQDKRVGATDDIETTNLDSRSVEYLYSENEGHILMDTETSIRKPSLRKSSATTSCTSSPTRN